MNQCNMESRRDKKELDKLRKTIEEFRAKAERSGLSDTSIYPETKNFTPQTDGYSPNEGTQWISGTSYSGSSELSVRQYGVLSPNTTNKRVSSGSLSSMSSHASHSSVSSTSSGGSNDSEQKQKRKRWLPLKSAFSRGNKTSPTNSHIPFTDADDSGYLMSPTRRSSRENNGEGVLSYNEILVVLQEKDRKLTDIRLEALTSQHQLHQLQDQIKQMQHDMELLRLENNRLQDLHQNSSSANTPRSASSTSNLRLKLAPNLHSMSLRGFETATSLEIENSSITTFDPSLPTLDFHKLYRIASPGKEEDGEQVRFVIATPPSENTTAQDCYQKDILIGSVPVPRKTTWLELDQMMNEIFMEYCRSIDNENRLGLNMTSVAFYKVGEQTRIPGTRPPDLMPCAFIIGNVDAIEISLKDSSHGAIDLLSFKTLIPKDILEKYVNEMLHSKRIILHGPSGTGKTSLAHFFAYHLISRTRKSNNETALYVYDVKQRGEKELMTYIHNVSKVCNGEINETLPHVIIVENAHALTSLKETFAPLVSISKNNKCPYVIGTMLQGKGQIADQSDFSWISCSNNSPHVKDYLARFLRRTMIENEFTEQSCEEEFQSMLRVITWLPLCWHHVNRCLEAHTTTDVTIGPRVFASYPSEFYASCSWFVQMWNHVIAPYIIAAIKRVRQSESGEIFFFAKSWVDPTEWVIDSFPWNVMDMGCDNTLRLRRIVKDDFNSPPLLPRNDLLQDKLQANTHPLKQHHSCNTGVEDIAQIGSSMRKLSLKRGKAPCIPPMQLIVQKTEADETVWLRHSSPVKSPSKNSIHTGGGRF